MYNYGSNVAGGVTATRSPYGAAGDYSNGIRLTRYNVSEARAPAGRDYGRFEAEHIATLSNVSRRTRLPEDVLGQLRQLEAAGQLYTMRVALAITQQALLVSHMQTGEVIEHFPLRYLGNSVGYMANRQNLLMVAYSVNDTSEVHVFNCFTTSATDVAERIKLAKVESTQFPIGRDEFSDNVLPPASAASNGFGDLYGPVRGGSNAQPVYAQRFSTLLQNRAMNGSYSDDAMQFQAMRDFQLRSEQNSLQAPYSGYQAHSSPQNRSLHNPYENHLQVLNWCFDDIEKFVGHLHRAVQAFRELEKRVQQRKQRAYMPGDGMLMRSARLPSDSELSDILQKFKFTLNLLGRVHQALSKPNAADVIHKMVPFLRTVVDACDTPGQQPLAPTIVSPLLSSEVITLLRHCLTSEETEFWRTLGEAWATPSEDWKAGAVDAYAPRFMNGYKLTALEAEELIYGNSQATTPLQLNGNGLNNLGTSSMNTPPLRVANLASQVAEEAQRRHEVDLTTGGYSPRGRGAAGNGTAQQYAIAPTSSDRALEKLEEVNQRYATELRARGAKAYEVTNEYQPKSGKEMSVLRGEVVEVLNDDRQWWKVRSVSGQVGYCPCTILRPLDALPPRDYDESAARGANRYNQLNSAAAYGTAVQSARVAPDIKSKPTPPKGYTVDRGALDAPIHVNNNSAQKSAYASATTSAVTNTWAHSAAYFNSDSSTYLPPVLGGSALGLSSAPRTVRPKSLSQLTLLPTSTPSQVEDWLKAKKFRPMTIMALRGLNGDQLFNLKTQFPELFDRCNQEDKKSLENNIQLQKNLSGYLTISKRQLSELLSQRRVLAEDAVPEHSDADDE